MSPPSASQSCDIAPFKLRNAEAVEMFPRSSISNSSEEGNSTTVPGEDTSYYEALNTVNTGRPAD